MTLNEIVKCRLVSRQIKNSVEYHLKTLCSLHVVDEWRSRIYQGLESLVQEKYLSQSTQVNIKFTFDNRMKQCVDPEFIRFLGEFCPNLSILDAEHLCSSFEDLLPVAGSLRFFSLKKFTFDKSELLDKFDKLECWKLQKEREDSYKVSLLLVKKLLQEKRPIFVVKNLSQDIDECTFEAITSSGVQSIICDASPAQLRSMPKCLVENLLDLSLSFVPRVGFVHSPIPSLKYLKVHRKFDEDEFETDLHTNLFFSSPHLRCFSYEGKMANKLLTNLFHHFTTLAKLKIVNLNLRRVAGSETVKLPLPSRLESFSLDSDHPFELTNSSSNLIQSFEMREMAKLEFDFPKLQELYISIGENAEASLLFTSLSKCTQLKSLTLRFGFQRLDNFNYSDIQTVIEIIGQMAQLKVLRVENYMPGTEELPPLVLKHENISSVRRLNWDSYGRIDFYPSDMFESLQISKSVQFKGSSQHVFTLRDQNLVTLYFTCTFIKLKRLELECSLHNQKILSEFDWEKFCELRRFDARMGRALSHVHFTCLFEALPKMKKLEKMTFTDWNCNHQDRSSPAERETIIFRQECIPSVKNIFWDVTGRLDFYPTDVFQELNISNFLVTLKNRKENACFDFRRPETIKIIITEKMQKLKSFNIRSIRLLEMEYINQLKYLSNLEKFSISSYNWSSPLCRAKMFRRILRFYKRLKSE